MANNWQEETLEVSGIPGMTAAMLLGLLFYLYTDHVQVAPHLVVRLGKLGVRIGLKHLASICFKQAGISQPDAEASSHFASDMSCLLEGEDFADVEFILSNGDRGAAGHKALLIQRCPFFERLFEGGFRESGDVARGELQRVRLLQDISAGVFQDFFRYLYTGDRLLFTAENIVPLLGAADAFMVDDLLQECVTLIEEGVDIGNACAVLSLGESSPLLARRAVH